MEIACPAGIQIAIKEKTASFSGSGYSKKVDLNSSLLRIGFRWFLSDWILLVSFGLDSLVSFGLDFFGFFQISWTGFFRFGYRFISSDWIYQKYVSVIE